MAPWQFNTKNESVKCFARRIFTLWNPLCSPRPPISVKCHNKQCETASSTRKSPPVLFMLFFGCAVAVHLWCEWNCCRCIVRTNVFSRIVAVNQTMASSSGTCCGVLERRSEQPRLFLVAPVSLQDVGWWKRCRIYWTKNFKTAKTHQLELYKFPSIVCSCWIILIIDFKRRLKKCPRRSCKKKKIGPIISANTKYRCGLIEKETPAKILHFAAVF